MLTCLWELQGRGRGCDAELDTKVRAETRQRLFARKFQALLKSLPPGSSSFLWLGPYLSSLLFAPDLHFASQRLLHPLRTRPQHPWETHPLPVVCPQVKAGLC